MSRPYFSIQPHWANPSRQGVNYGRKKDIHHQHWSIIDEVTGTYEVTTKELRIPNNCENPLNFVEKMTQVSNCLTGLKLWNKYLAKKDAYINYKNNSKSIDEDKLLEKQVARDTAKEAYDYYEATVKTKNYDTVNGYKFEIGCYVAVNGAPKEFSVYNAHATLRKTVAYWQEWFDKVDSVKEHEAAKAELKDAFLELASHYLNTREDDDFKNITLQRLNDTKFKTIVGNLARTYKWSANGMKGGLQHIAEAKDTTQIENTLASAILSAYLHDKFKFGSNGTSKQDSKIYIQL